MVFVYQKMSTLSKTFAAPFSRKLYDSDSNVASVGRVCVCVLEKRAGEAVKVCLADQSGAAGQPDIL